MSRVSENLSRILRSYCLWLHKKIAPQSRNRSTKNLPSDYKSIYNSFYYVSNSLSSRTTGVVENVKKMTITLYITRKQTRAPNLRSNNRQSSTCHRFFPVFETENRDATHVCFVSFGDGGKLFPGDANREENTHHRLFSWKSRESKGEAVSHRHVSIFIETA